MKFNKKLALSCVFFLCLSQSSNVSFGIETKTGEPNSNRVSGVLIGSVNTQRSLMPSCRTLEHAHLTQCLDFDLRVNKMHSVNKVAFQQTMNEQLQFVSLL